MIYCFFFKDTATTEIYTLSRHHTLPILLSLEEGWPARFHVRDLEGASLSRQRATHLGLYEGRLPESSPALYEEGEAWRRLLRSEEHTSELQSRQYLVCRLLLD